MTWIRTQKGTLINAAKMGAIELNGPFIEWFINPSDEDRCDANSDGQLFTAPDDNEKLTEKVFETICAQLAIEEPLIDVPQIERGIRLGVES